MADRALSVTLAAFAALAAWFSLGTQAVVDVDSAVRIGRLPPWWVLAVLGVAFTAPVLARRVGAGRLWPLALSGFVCLPWLPGAVPAAFLIWSGPAAMLVWLLVAAGLVVSAPVAWPATAQAWARDPRRAPVVLALLVVVLGALGAWAMRSRIPDGDEPHYLVITQSLLQDGDLRIENNHRQHDYLAYIDREIPPDYLQRGSDGEIYPIHAPGVSALVAPGFAAAGWAGAVASLLVMAGLAAALVWRAAWRLTSGDVAAAWAAGVSLALTAPGYFHAFTVFPDGPGACAVALALVLLVHLETGTAISTRFAGATGAALALLPWLHTRFAVLAGGLGLVFAVRLWHHPARRRLLPAFLTTPAIAATAWFAFFWVIWGTPNPTAPYGQATQSAWAHLTPAIPGLLFDQQFGLLPNAPIYGVALLGMASLWRRHGRLALEVGLVAVVYTVAVGAYRMWWGGHSAPARFLVAALPLLTVPLAAWWHQGSASRRALGLVLLFLSLVLVAVRVTVDGGALVYNTRDGADRLLDWASPLVHLPLAVPSLHRDIVGVALSDIAVWCGAAGLLFTVAVRSTRRRGPPWTVLAAALLVAVMGAATVVWGTDRRALAPEASAVHLLRAWPPDGGGVFWQSAPYGLVGRDAVLARLRVTGTPADEARRRGGLFAAPLVPAGEYVIEGVPAGLAGELRVVVGESSTPLDVFTSPRAPQGDPWRLRLPVHVRDLRIQGEGDARSAIAIALRPLAGWSPDLHGLTASGATCIGEARVFALDDGVYLEPTGFWTRGGRTAEVVIEVPAQPLQLTLRPGPVPVRVEVAADSWRETLELNGESRVVRLPSGSAARLIRVTTSTGFRPFEHDPASTDRRDLGVWVEVGAAASAAPTTGRTTAARSGRRP